MPSIDIINNIGGNDNNTDNGGNGGNEISTNIANS